VGTFVSKDHNGTFNSNWIIIFVFLGDENTHGWDNSTMSFGEFPVFGESEFRKSVKFAKSVTFLFL
jgi:hypothetical protein